MGTSTQIQPEGYYGHKERNQEPAVRKGLGEKEERALSKFNLSVRKLRQFFSILHVLVLFNSYLCYLFRHYEQRVRSCREVDRLQKLLCFPGEH